MEEQLDSLLEKIKREGVDKAKAEADLIIKEAGRKADEMLKDADAKANALRESAERDSAVYAERSQTSIRQAARDIILSVGSALSNVALAVARRETQTALNTETLRDLIKTVIETYTQGKTSGGIEVLLNPEQKQQVVDSLMRKLSDAVKEGVTLQDDAGIVSGFRVSIPDKQVEHDFTDEAIAEALSELLRPELGEIVRSAVDS